jgi:hypothetical protein
MLVVTLAAVLVGFQLGFQRRAQGNPVYKRGQAVEDGGAYHGKCIAGFFAADEGKKPFQSFLKATAIWHNCMGASQVEVAPLLRQAEYPFCAASQHGAVAQVDVPSDVFRRTVQKNH